MGKYGKQYGIWEIGVKIWKKCGNQYGNQYGIRSGGCAEGVPLRVHRASGR